MAELNNGIATREWTRGTAAQRAANTAVPAGGELGAETDTGRFVGADGVKPWNALSPFATLADVAAGGGSGGGLTLVDNGNGTTTVTTTAGSTITIADNGNGTSTITA